MLPSNFKNLSLKFPWFCSREKVICVEYFINFIIISLLAFYVITSATIGNNNGNSTNSWCIPFFISNSSKYVNPFSTFVFTPSCKPISARTITYNLPFFLMAHSITYFGNLSNAFFHINKTHESLLLLLLLFLPHFPHNDNCIHCSFSRHKFKLHFVQIDQCSYLPL